MEPNNTLGPYVVSGLPNLPLGWEANFRFLLRANSPRNLAICQIWAFSKLAAGKLLAFSGYFVDTWGVRLPMDEVLSL